MTVKVAISGFGRIGRNVLRAAAEAKRTDLQFVAINDLGPTKDNAHLFKYDSVHGTFPGDVKVAVTGVGDLSGALEITSLAGDGQLSNAPGQAGPAYDLSLPEGTPCDGTEHAEDAEAESRESHGKLARIRRTG
mgnify:CR=1 FL=1